MRLVLRANAHRQVAAGCREVAASPDTPRREPWQWHVRLLTDAEARSGKPPSAIRVAEALPGGVTLEVCADSGSATPAVEVVDPSGSPAVDREEDELVVLIASGGRVLVEDRHLLADADAMVLEGDDPLRVSLRRPDGSDSRVAVVRFGAAGRGPLAWVP
ncbi:hypothetical protein EOT10_18910 [Streptomyces antnestii]|uniref:HutD family protein n=1 Tax=Streptomyces antnestii TaxID=2494256 RepID=A0A437PLG0_9ACTN|nr:hypothetical protein [Streptomyces sp. San01]RVU23125.1 hypothetical protein EOT10_18910 [Streptomyces sp. San01]